MHKQKTISIVVSTLLLSLSLTGCGGGSSANTADNTNDGTIIPQDNISGSAVDGYLRYSTVCLDLNDDGFCQPNEPYAITDENGSFSLPLTASQKANANIQTAQLLVYGGKDSDTAEDFIGKLKAPNDGSGTINITPITTLVAANINSSNAGTQKEKIANAKAKVAKILGLTQEQVGADPIVLAKNGNSSVLSKALQLQKAVEKIVITAKNGENNDAKSAATLKVFKNLAQSLNGKTTETNVSDIIENAKDGIKTSLDINDTIIDSTISNAKNLATVVHTVFKDKKSNMNATQISDLSNIIATVKEQQYIPSSITQGELETLQGNAKTDEVKRILLGLGVSESDINSTYSNSLTDLADLINPRMTLVQMKTSLVTNGNYPNLVTLLNNKITLAKQEKEEIQQQTDVTNTAKPFIALTLPFEFYSAYKDNSYHIEKNIFGTDDIIEINESKYNASTQSFDAITNDDTNYILSSNGEWISQKSNKTFQLQSDNSLSIFNGKFGIVEIKDIAGAYSLEKDQDLDLDFNITMPSGAKEYLAKYEPMESRYTIYEPQRNWNDSENGTVTYYTTFQSVIEGQCGRNRFMGNSQGGYAFAGTQTDSNGNTSYSCDGTATSGKLFAVENSDNGSKIVNKDAGTWEIKEIQGKQILIATPYDKTKYGGHQDNFFTVANPDGTGDKIWQGNIMQKGEPHTWREYNKIAIDAIKEAIKAEANVANSTSNSSDATPTNTTKPFIALTLPFEFYDVYHYDSYNIEKNAFATDGTSLTTYSEYNSSTQRFSSQTKNDNYDYILSSNGQWLEKSIFKTFKQQSDNSLSAFDGNGKLGLIETKDIAGAYSPEKDSSLDFSVTMPSGAKEYLLKFEAINMIYDIYQPQRNGQDSENGKVAYYTTFQSVIEGQCSTHYFMGNRQGGYAFAGTQINSNGNTFYRCNETATSGKLFAVENSDNGSKIVNKDAGTWEIKEIQGKQILIATPYDKTKYGGHSNGLFTIANPDGTGDKVWHGTLIQKGESHTWTTYNKIAIDAIKEAIKVQ